MNLVKDLRLRGLLAIALAIFPLATKAQERVPDTSRFCGTWEYTDEGEKQYLRISKAGIGRIKLIRGFEYPKGKISWAGIIVKNADGIYLKPINGRLEGRFVSSNFYPTHSEEFTYKITCELKSNNRLLYSVWSSIKKEKRTAIKISD